MKNERLTSAAETERNWTLQAITLKGKEMNGCLTWMPHIFHRHPLWLSWCHLIEPDQRLKKTKQKTDKQMIVSLFFQTVCRLWKFGRAQLSGPAAAPVGPLYAHSGQSAPCSDGEGNPCPSAGESPTAATLPPRG